MIFFSGDVHHPSQTFIFRVFFGIPNEVLGWFKQKISGLWLHGCFFWNPNTWIFQKFVAFHPKNRPKGRIVTYLEDPGISICISLSRITLKMNKAGFWSLLVWRIIPIWETSQTMRRLWNCSTSLGDVWFFLGVAFYGEGATPIQSVEHFCLKYSTSMSKSLYFNWNFPNDFPLCYSLPI